MSQHSSRNRMIFAIGMMCFITLISFVYAFVQQAEAKRQTTMAIECEKRSIELVQQIERERRQAEQQFIRAEEALKGVEELKSRKN